MKGYESRVWVCWPLEEFGHTQPDRCTGEGHHDCGLHDILVPVSYSPKRKEEANKQRTRVQGEAIRR